MLFISDIASLFLINGALNPVDERFCCFFLLVALDFFSRTYILWRYFTFRMFFFFLLLLVLCLVGTWYLHQISNSDIAEILPKLASNTKQSNSASQIQVHVCGMSMNSERKNLSGILTFDILI